MSVALTPRISYLGIRLQRPLLSHTEFVALGWNPAQNLEGIHCVLRRISGLCAWVSRLSQPALCSTSFHTKVGPVFIFTNTNPSRSEDTELNLSLDAQGPLKGTDPGPTQTATRSPHDMTLRFIEPFTCEAKVATDLVGDLFKEVEERAYPTLGVQSVDSSFLRSRLPICSSPHPGPPSLQVHNRHLQNSHWAYGRSEPIFNLLGLRSYNLHPPAPIH